ncbi:MAG: ABC transporter ATP-binding protein [Deltaproteobacteria bacterium]|nr:ABC transporter ATP-binding protein [Deltaproteobacteria bacterium]
MDYLLETRGLTIHFGGLVAIRDLDSFVSKGEVLGLIGPNGSGKTTYINLITGIYSPTSGDIEFQGESIVGLAPFQLVHRGIARTFQNSRLFSNLSVLDNIIIGMHHKQRTQWYDAVFRSRFARQELKNSAKRAVELLEYFSKELVDERFKRAIELPQAYRRKLEICRALASDPVLLLLDEPAAGMDQEETLALMEDIRRILEWKKDLAIIIVEHDMMVIKNIADRVLVINYGQKIAEGTFDHVSNNPEVITAYLGESQC